MKPFGYVFCYQGHDVCYSNTPQDGAIPVAYYWQQPVYTEDQVKVLIAKAGKVMREQAATELVDLYDRTSTRNIYDFAEAIRAIPGVKLEDLK